MSYICFKNVSKSFNKNPVISSADFMIAKGEICGFIGRNGSGKTVVRFYSFNDTQTNAELKKALEEDFYVKYPDIRVSTEISTGSFLPSS